MRISEHFFVIFVLTSLLVAIPTPAQKQLAQSPRILSAKSVYFENRTGSDAVGKNALAQLKKWGKFRLVADPKVADLVFLLSADPTKAETSSSRVAGQAALTIATSPKTLSRTTTSNLPQRCVPDGD